jgi:hypothetical protein
MAAKKTVAEEVVKDGISKDDKVLVYMAKVRGFEEEDVHVSVNGKIYVIKRGETVSVPRAVAEILNEKNRLEDAADSYVAQAIERSKEDK